MTTQDEADRIRRNLIEKRAFEIYQARGGQHGFDEADWAEAERDVEGLRVDNDALPDPEDEKEADEQAGSI